MSVSTALRNFIYEMQETAQVSEPLAAIEMHPAAIMRLDREFDQLAYMVVHGPGSKTERRFMGVLITEGKP